MQSVLSLQFVNTMIDLKHKNILITGSKGFIGKHLSQFILDNALYSRLTLVDIDEDDSIDGSIVRVKGSFCDDDVVEKILRNQDVVFHLAAMVGVYNCLNNKADLRKINLDDTKKFIDSIIKADCQKIVFSSSSEVYGDSRKVPYEENDTPSPVSDYAKYKIAIEEHLKQESQDSRIMVSIVRFFNIYGPDQRLEFVVPKFLDMAKNNKNISVNGDGSQTRSFTFVDDAVQGLIKAMQYDETKYEIFNIGNNKEIPIVKLANSILSLVPGTKSKIYFVSRENLDRYDSNRRVPSIDKAKIVLEFQPTVDLEDGLKKMFNG